MNKKNLKNRSSSQESTYSVEEILKKKIKKD
jgi:hypothetical protein